MKGSINTGAGHSGDGICKLAAYERRLRDNDCGAQCFINGPTDR